MKKALVLNNVVVQISDAEFPVNESFTWMDCPDNVKEGWEFKNNAFSEITPISVTTFTPLEFLSKFTPSEQLNVVTATLASPALKLWYDMMLAASFVDITDQRTIDGLTALVAAGLITENRKIEILG